MNGAEAMVKCLEEEGVTRIFGYPGVAISPFYEALYNAGTIEHVLVRQEQAAGHAASGYARISRKAAVCVTSSGPGATNLITALHDREVPIPHRRIRILPLHSTTVSMMHLAGKFQPISTVH